MRFVNLIIVGLYFLRMSIFSDFLGEGLLPITYAFLLFSSFLQLFSVRSNVNVYVLFLVFAAGISIFLNDIPSFFKSEYRYILWGSLLVYSCALYGSNSQILQVRKLIVRFSIVVILVSFLCLFIHILPYEMLYIKKPYFNGVMAHSMLLGPLAAVVILDLIGRMKYKSIYDLSLIMISLYVLLLSSSRIAIIGVFVSFFYFVSVKFSFKKRLVVLFSIACCLFLAISFYPQLFSGLFLKGDGFSRAYLWELRIREYIGSPYFGVGFSSIGRDAINLGLKFDQTTGVVEPGSSYLAVASMCGSLGVLSFFIFMLWLFIKRNSVPLNIILLHVFFCIHFIAEGYVFSCGYLLSLLFWVNVGAFRYLKYEKNIC